MTEVREQMTEVREQMTEVREQMTEYRVQMSRLSSLSRGAAAAALRRRTRPYKIIFFIVL